MRKRRPSPGDRAITDQLGQGSGNGHRVLEALFDGPIVSVADVKEVVGTSCAAANTLVSRLVDMDILKEVTGNARNRRFRYEPYIELFTDQ